MQAVIISVLTGKGPLESLLKELADVR